MSNTLKQKTYLITTTECNFEVIDRILKSLYGDTITVTPYKEPKVSVDTDNNDIPAQALYKDKK